jgi:hypothetical protein
VSGRDPWAADLGAAAVELFEEAGVRLDAIRGDGFAFDNPALVIGLAQTMATINLAAACRSGDGPVRTDLLRMEKWGRRS